MPGVRNDNAIILIFRAQGLIPIYAVLQGRIRSCDAIIRGKTGDFFAFNDSALMLHPS
jgi:hypothetical protein